jgi:hypothetical protein
VVTRPGDIKNYVRHCLSLITPNVTKTPWLVAGVLQIDTSAHDPPPPFPALNEKKGGCASGLRQRENSADAGNLTGVLQARSQPTVH